MKCNRPVNSYSRALLILSYCVQVPYWAMNVNQRCLPVSVYLTKSYPYLTSYHQHLTQKSEKTYYFFSHYIPLCMSKTMSKSNALDQIRLSMSFLS